MKREEMKRFLDKLKSLFGRSRAQVKTKGAEAKRRKNDGSKKDTQPSRIWPTRQEKHKGPKF